MTQTPPKIDNSTREERLRFVQERWKCMHNCEICGKCHILHGVMAEDAYRDYIDGCRSYMEVTLELRRI